MKYVHVYITIHVQYQHLLPMQEVVFSLCREAEMKSVEVRVVEGHAAHVTFMWESVTISLSINPNLKFLRIKS